MALLFRLAYELEEAEESEDGEQQQQQRPAAAAAAAADRRTCLHLLGHRVGRHLQLLVLKNPVQVCVCGHAPGTAKVVDVAVVVVVLQVQGLAEVVTRSALRRPLETAAGGALLAGGADADAEVRRLQQRVVHAWIDARGGVDVDTAHRLMAAVAASVLRRRQQRQRQTPVRLSFLALEIAFDFSTRPVSLAS